MSSARHLCAGPIVALALAVLDARAQTTRGLLAGRIVDSRTLEPVGGAIVLYENPSVNLENQAKTDSDGRYTVPLLPPGFYAIRISKAGYQTMETRQVELRVASRVKLDVRLRRLTDVWEKDVRRSITFPDSDAVLTFYGPDVDTARHATFEPNPGQPGALDATVSEVIAPDTIRRLPLLGRDAYTMLVTLPGVVTETSTGRGLGLAINGQRPASSSFLLDSASNNNRLVTGPLTALPPEAIQEYRVSINNFSAEYGGTSGYLANAITRSGGSSWHGILYGNFRHGDLNSNTVLNELEGIGKPRLEEHQAGFHAGGPATSRLFLSAAFEDLRSRGELEEVAIRAPSPALQVDPNRRANGLMTQFPPPVSNPGTSSVVDLNVRPPVTVNRYLGLGRIDYRSADGRQQALARVSISRFSRPDFIWTPYEDFVSGMQQPVTSAALGLTTIPGPRWANEIIAGWSDDDIRWERAHPDIPTIEINTTLTRGFDTIADLSRLTIVPGSPALYDFSNRGRTLEVRDNLSFVRDRHILKFGAAFQRRAATGVQTTGRDGRYIFPDLVDFILDKPSDLSIAVSRTALPELSAPVYDRRYREHQAHFFAQDTIRIGKRFVLNPGIRYEVLSDIQDTPLPGSPVSSRALFAPGNRWAGQFGLSYAFGTDARTVVRGAYGIFHDSTFENVWQSVRNNSVSVPTFRFADATPLPCDRTVDPMCRSISRLDVDIDRTRFTGQNFADDFPQRVLLDPNLTTGYAQSFFLGVQREVTRDWNLEINGLGSLGRKLITTDTLRRTAESEDQISYRANQGASRYLALTAVGRYRNAWGLLRLSYTFSGTRDHQSDPLAGDFLALTFTNYRRRIRPRLPKASFSMEGDNRADWANADFDQRHNYVVYSHWDVPPVFRDMKLAPLFRSWRFAHLAAFRSGFPFTVRSAASGTIINQRADLVAPDRALIDEPIAGGKRLLNAAAFRLPETGRLGNSGRNSFRGPGFYNADISVSRVFRPQWLREGRRIEVRADIFNVLNHSNLNPPDSFLSSNTFGQALRGRPAPEAGFPALTPLDETPRQIQLIVRFEF